MGCSCLPPVPLRRGSVPLARTAMHGLHRGTQACLPRHWSGGIVIFSLQSQATIGCRRIRAQHGGISRPLFPAVPLTTNLQPLHLSTSTWQRCPHAGWVRVVMAGGGVHSVHPADVVLAASRAVANLLLQSAVGDAVCQGQAQLRYRVCALCSHGNGHAHRQQQQEHPHAATMRGDDAVRASSDGWYGTSSSQRPVLLAALPCLLGHGVTLVRLWQQGLLLAQAQ